MVAFATCTSDVVRVAGGWLCDQVLAGWDATAVTMDHADQRSLRILGVRGFDFEKAMSRPTGGGCLQAIVVDSEIYQADERVRRMVRGAAEAGRTDIRIWGDVPDDFDGAGLITHRLSAAARAFKAQALAADSADPRLVDTEEFRRAALRRLAAVLAARSAA
jgi:hypothetical protein